MFLRFVIDDLDAGSGRRQGLLRRGGALQGSGRMRAEDAARLEQIHEWFNAHLPVPDRFALSSRPHAKAQALSWFRDSAEAYIARMREYQWIVERYRVRVEMLQTRRPGYVVYQDDYQVVAYPFADTVC